MFCTLFWVEHTSPALTPGVAERAVGVHTRVLISHGVPTAR